MGYATVQFYFELVCLISAKRTSVKGAKLAFALALDRGSWQI
jgi:hypothetical protein